MKKLLAILAFGLAAGVASAQGYGALEYEDSENRVTHADSYSTGVILGYKTGAWSLSGKVSQSQAELGNGAITNRYEARAKHSWAVSSTRPYLGVRLGENVTATNNFSYYAVDAGLVIPTSDRFAVDFSYRYRDAFKESNNFQTNRYGVEGVYKVTNKDSLGLRYARSYGDSETDSWRLQYTHSF